MDGLELSNKPLKKKLTGKKIENNSNSSTAERNNPTRTWPRAPKRTKYPEVETRTTKGWKEHFNSEWKNISLMSQSQDVLKYQLQYFVLSHHLRSVPEDCFVNP